MNLYNLAVSLIGPVPLMFEFIYFIITIFLFAIVAFFIISPIIAIYMLVR